MTVLETKQRLEDILTSFSDRSLKESALALFERLGYRSEKRLDLAPNTADGFLDTFDLHNTLNEERALLDDWRTVEILFQLTADEITQDAQPGMFSGGRVDNTIIESYLFLALDLTGEHYTRTQLAQITREINRQFPMPVLLLFRHGPTLTLSVINRRLHKRDSSKDVLEKVTLIKDINLAQPHRAHLEILFDLSLPQLYQKHSFTNFVELHQAWQQTLDSSELNKRFFQEVANWYFWAVQEVTFPKDAHPDLDIRNATSVIRLITRLIFVWFIKEKGLVPPDLFIKRRLNEILNYKDPQDSTYYKAILQNLFFATLNQEMNTDERPENRKFRHRANQVGRRDQHYQHYLIHNVYRYEAYFKDPGTALQLFANIPFLNGGLFECLDHKHTDTGAVLRVDGFSDHPKNELVVPDYLFFSGQQDIDLNEIYGTNNKRYNVRGLLNILDSYKFTIAENTPIEEEVALDPELLGKVFENLLAAYNPETKTTARKQTGSFYTPREIVNYMVDESLIAYLCTQLQAALGKGNYEVRLRHLFAYNDEPRQFSRAEVSHLIEAIDKLKILDPACGSGAFPMGILHKLVFILGKLDPDNERWRELQRQKAIRETEHAFSLGDKTERERRLLEINEVFERNTSDYGRKLYLIENCIYGVDIQPIAVQIAKLRFFISLVVDQIIDDGRPNRGVLPLPNLETKFVAANTLLGIERPPQLAFKDPAIAEKEAQLEEVRHSHFTARTPRTKDKYRLLDAQIRAAIGELLGQNGFRPETTEQLAVWNPYGQNASADFFDPEWMFGIVDGFDIVIANPPYISALDFANMFGLEMRQKLNATYITAKGSYDVYVLFLEKRINLTKNQGILTYITPNKYLSAKYGSALRKFILDQASLDLVVDLSPIRIFEEASVYPVVSLISKRKKPDNYVKTILPTHRQVDHFHPSDFRRFQISRTFLRALPENIWGFLLSRHADLLSKLIVDTEPLEKFGSINATSTAAEADMYGEFVSDKCDDRSLKIINTGTIDRYETLWGKREMVHGGRKYLTPYLPLSKASVNQRRQRMYQTPKIVFAKMAKECEAFIDFDGKYASINTNCFYDPRPGITLQYIGAFCNSRLFMFLYQQFFGALRMSGGYYQFQAPQLRVMPCKMASNDQQGQFVDLVNQINAAKRAIPAADTAVLEAEIDRLVYQLYGLTDEEIAIVEGR